MTKRTVQRPIACRVGRAAGVRLRACRGNRCGPNWWSRWPMNTCKAIAFGIWPIFGAGEPIKRRRIALTPNSKSFLPKSLNQFSRMAARRALGGFAGASRFGWLGFRRVIRIGCFGRRTQFLGNMAEIDADARPCRGPATHRVDQHIIHGQKRSRVGMPALPSLEALQCSRSEEHTSELQSLR